MSRLRATVLVTIAVLGCSAQVGPVAGTTVATGRQHGGGGGVRLWSPTDWYRAAVDGCGMAGWPQCVTRKVARTLQLLEDADDLHIADGVRLVKTAKRTTTDHRSARNYSSDVIDRIVSFVDSHSLQIDLWIPDNNSTVEGRRRHAYRKVFPIIVSTYMIMSAVLIPMGFMFMSTLGGKALLVSKMALMVSLMSNIKKMFSYEYYVPPSAPPASHHHWKRTLLAHRTTAGPLYSSYTAY